MRIAAWSGPRNLSTAMMYAFAARGDCAVIDEPFYAAYLARTGLDHPMREAILAAGPTEPAQVVARLTGPVPDGRPHLYQKHMAQHMIDGIDRGWIAQMVNIFLIRAPERVIASYAARRARPSLDDLGYRQQAELFDRVRRITGRVPPVLDSEDIRADPEAALKALCAAIGLDYRPAMLSWPAGGHPGDGVWAPHWYGAVHRSTGFAGPEGPLPDLPGPLRPLLEQARPFYRHLRRHRLWTAPPRPAP